MAKSRALHVCSNCDAQFPRWSGRCESCGSWGTVGKDPVIPGAEDAEDQKPSVAPGKVLAFSSLQQTEQQHGWKTGCAALDTVLGGVISGSVTLIGGEPGMGKSTILSQAALSMALDGKRVLYVTGEESPSQIQIRLQRLLREEGRGKPPSPTASVGHRREEDALPEGLCYLDDMRSEVIRATMETEKPDAVIVDSIQTVRTAETSGEAGSVSQVRASAAVLTQAAKQTNIPLFLVGQVTKDGDLAGPRLLEHIVDTVLSLEGDKLHRFRILRAIKHRFGSTDESILMDMTSQGLEPITDPSHAILESRPTSAAGSAIGCVIEGRRPLLIELQALVTPSGYSSPTRKSTGLDSSRLNMLLAVLTRHANIAVYDKDVYANAAGGLGVRDPAADLTLAAAIASAVKKTPLDPKTAYFGEIGLTGELRPVALPDLRIKELARMGFTTVVCPAVRTRAINGVTIHNVKTLKEALD